MIKCLVCNKEYKKITALHVRTHGMELDEYALLAESREIHTKESGITKEFNMLNDMISDVEEIENDSLVQAERVVKYTEEPVETNYEERINSIFKDSIKERDQNRPISEFLTEFDITEKELRQVVRQYKGGNSISISQGLANKAIRAKNIAESLSDRDMVETRDSFTAEILEANYGFTCIEVRSGPPKMWVLHKQ
jgi:hypothetical protein